MNGRHPMCILHSFSIKNMFYDKMDLRLFSFSCDNVQMVCSSSTFVADVLCDPQYISSRPEYHQSLKLNSNRKYFNDDLKFDLVEYLKKSCKCI